MSEIKFVRDWYIRSGNWVREVIDDTELDMEEKFSADEMLEKCLDYEGIIGYQYKLKHLFEDLYLEDEVAFSFDELRSFCIEHDYFTAGTNEQYEKMFRKAEYGIKLSELALIIHMCSEYIAEADIYNELVEMVERRRKLEEETAAEELEFVLDCEDPEAELYDDGGIV